MYCRLIEIEVFFLTVSDIQNESWMDVRYNVGRFVVIKERPWQFISRFSAHRISERKAKHNVILKSFLIQRCSYMLGSTGVFVGSASHFSHIWRFLSNKGDIPILSIFCVLSRNLPHEHEMASYSINSQREKVEKKLTHKRRESLIHKWVFAPVNIYGRLYCHHPH